MEFLTIKSYNEACIKCYFDEKKWEMLSDLQKKIFFILKRNYEYLRWVGLNPKVPQFMKKTPENNSGLKSGPEIDLLKTHKHRTRQNCARNEKDGFPTGVSQQLKPLEQPKTAGKMIHRCTQCQYSTQKLRQLWSHVLKIHDRVPIYKCPHCEFSAYRRSHFQSHIIAFHEGKKYKCRHCTHAATELDSLRKHEDLKPRRASPSSTLRKYVKGAREDVRPNRCPHCKYGSSDFKDLSKHVKEVHEDFRPHPCPQCDCRAFHPDTIRNHVNAVHVSKIASERNKQNECSFQAMEK